MISSLTRFPLALALVVMLVAPVMADVLLLQAIQAAPENSPTELERPRSGATMDTVIARFGQPQDQRTAVGDPPITRWIHDQYTVYFEYNRVIHSVVHRPAFATNPQPSSVPTAAADE